MPAQCGCKQHEQFLAGKNFTLVKVAGKKFPVKVINALIDKNLLSSRATYLCTACANYDLESGPSDPKVHISHSQYVDIVTNLILDDELDSDDLCKLSAALGKSQSKSLLTESINRQTEYQDDEFLKNLKFSEWLDHVNPVLLCFLKQICNFSELPENKKRMTSLVRAIENIYFCRNLNIILPLSFFNNLLSHFISGSKSICEINSAMSPSGSYASVLNWIAAHSVSEIEVPNQHDLITYFDNNQVLSRNWRVRYDAKAIVSVITNLIHILPFTSTSIQNNADLSPSCWLFQDSSDIVSKINNYIDNCNPVFESYQNSFIEQRMKSVLSEPSNLIDENIKYIKKETTQKPLFPRPSKSDDPYCFVSCSSAKKPNSVITGNPVMVNPCSYEAVEKVFEHILKATCQTRQWTVVGCDGSWITIRTREQVKENMLSLLGLEEFNDIYHCDLSEEIVQWRTKIRMSSYVADVESETPHVNIKGEKLDRELCGFQEKANDNMSQYIRSFAQGNPIGKAMEKLTPVFITPADREKYNDLANQTKPAISLLITSAIDRLKSFSPQKASAFLMQWEKDIKRQTKACFVTFYKKVMASLEEEQSEVDLGKVMQCGFAFLEVGAVRSKNATSILIQNVLNSFVSAAAYWLFGYAFAYGDGGAANVFIGATHFASHNLLEDKYALFFFQYTFAATASTIVSRALSERCEFIAYIVVSFFVTGFIYPIVSHWAWGGGWLSQGIDYPSYGVVAYQDFAGSGVVHVLGGVTAFVGAWMIGPRIGRFDKATGTANIIRGHSVPLAALGGFIIFFGMLALNGGSRLSFSAEGDGAVVTVSVVNTIISATFAVLTSVIIHRVKMDGNPGSVLVTVNGAFTGMVAASAGCNRIYPWGACVIGIFASVSYHLWSAIMRKLRIDDPVDAVAVHFGGGAWGVIAVAFLDKNDGILMEWNARSGHKLAWQLCGVIAITAWTAFFSILLFGILHGFDALRVSLDVEDTGLDIPKHNEPAYPPEAYLPEQFDEIVTVAERPLVSAHNFTDDRVPGEQPNEVGSHGYTVMSTYPDLYSEQYLLPQKHSDRPPHYPMVATYPYWSDSPRI